MAVDVGDLEEALVYPRSVYSLHPRFLLPFLRLAEPVQAHVCVQYAPIRRFSIRLQPKRCVALLEPLFELPQVVVHYAQIVREYPLTGIVPATQALGANRFVQFTRRT